MMISLGGFAIVDAPAPAWWHDDRAAREARFADLDRRIEEARREIEKNSGPRRRPAATRPAGSATTKPVIDTEAIYRERNRPRAAAEPERSTLCEQGCYAATTSDPDLCDGEHCWASKVGARSALGHPRPPVRPERGGMSAVRPRTFAEIAADVYHETPTVPTESGLIATSPRGSRP